MSEDSTVKHAMTELGKEGIRTAKQANCVKVLGPLPYEQNH